MDATLNNGAWSEMEDFWKEMAKQDGKFEIDLSYERPPMHPEFDNS